MKESLDSEAKLKMIIQSKSIKDGRLLASNYDRFFGHLIDLLCVFPIFLSYIFLMEHHYGEIQDGEFFRQPIWLGFYILIMFLAEAIFLKTPGKISRSTIIVNYDGSRPSTSSILIRNLCRMIPFDSISFLIGNNGWHDSLSKTYVIYRDEF